MSEALAEPVVRVRRGWMAWLFFANLGLWLAVFAPIQVLLPQQAELLNKANKELVFGIVAGFGGLVSLVVVPLIGFLSDRTTSRFGRRHPWTLAGATIGATGLGVLANAPSVVVMTIGWCLVQAGIGGMLAAVTAAVPDRVPVVQRAQVGGLIGISQMLGTVLGAVVVTMLVSGLQAGYLACAVIVLTGAILFVLRTPDTQLIAKPVTPTLWISPRRHPDFAWAWAGHLMINMGNAFGTLYLLYFLGDAVRHPSPEDGLLELMVLYGVALTAGAVLFGARSDRSGRRKPYVYGAAAVMALAALILVIWPTWAAVLVAAPLLGLGFGTYMAVAIALLTQVLPAATDRAKDLGVLNVANALPQVIAPLLSALILANLGGYRGLFAVSALATTLAAVLLSRVRSVV